jgi:ADP-ribose pyrophosphatase YjhB (NUDIX family)
MEALRKPGMIHVKAMCILAYEGKLLATEHFDTFDKQKFFRLIGGGVHFCEQSIDALRREIREELKSELENITFMNVFENIFTYEGQPGHEIIFLYTADLVRKELYKLPEIPIADHPSIIAKWVPVMDVVSGKESLFPSVDYSPYQSAQ